MKVLICGDRNWDDLETMLDVFESIEDDIDTVIHGDARGADSLAGTIAMIKGKHVIAVPADWKTHGRAAGPIRNRKMFDENKPDLVIAFHKNISESKGTKDMVNYATKKGCKVIIVDGK